MLGQQTMLLTIYCGWQISIERKTIRIGDTKYHIWCSLWLRESAWGAAHFRQERRWHLTRSRGNGGGIWRGPTGTVVALGGTMAALDGPAGTALAGLEGTVRGRAEEGGRGEERVRAWLQRGPGVHGERKACSMIATHCEALAPAILGRPTIPATLPDSSSPYLASEDLPSLPYYYCHCIWFARNTPVSVGCCTPRVCGLFVVRIVHWGERSRWCGERIVWFWLGLVFARFGEFVFGWGCELP